MRISAFTSDSLASVLRLLQDEIPLEAVTEANFARKVLLDANFDPAGAFIAQDDSGDVVGFVMALTRLRPLEDGPTDRERGWITLFAVSASYRRECVGTRLFDRAEGWLRERGCTAVWVSPYAPNYWTPGVDTSAYPEAEAFLHGRGYETVLRPHAMQAQLDTAWQIPQGIREHRQLLETVGVEIVPFQISHILALTEFLRREFPGDWQRYVRETMLEIVADRRPATELILAMDKSEVVGFAQSDAERFGPFGVAAAERGRGIGIVLLYTALEGMRTRGHQTAWFLWTNDETAKRLYRPAGFKRTRRFSILKKLLV